MIIKSRVQMPIRRTFFGRIIPEIDNSDIDRLGDYLKKRGAENWDSLRPVVIEAVTEWFTAADKQKIMSNSLVIHAETTPDCKTYDVEVWASNGSNAVSRVTPDFQDVYAKEVADFDRTWGFKKPKEDDLHRMYKVTYDGKSAIMDEDKLESFRQAVGDRINYYVVVESESAELEYYLDKFGFRLVANPPEPTKERSLYSIMGYSALLTPEQAAAMEHYLLLIWPYDPKNYARIAPQMMVRDYKEPADVKS